MAALSLLFAAALNIRLSFGFQVLYENAGPLDPQSEDLLTNINMTDDMFIKMDILVESYPTSATSAWQYLFFIGDHYVRVPDIQLWNPYRHASMNGFAVQFTGSSGGRFINPLSGSSDTIELNKVYTLEVCYNQTNFTTRLSGGNIDGIYTLIANKPIHDNVEEPVYLGYPGNDYDDADAIITNLYIGSNADCSQPLDISTGKLVYVNTSMTASAAKAYCESEYNGNIASIHSVEQNAIITNLCVDQGQTQAACWLGISNEISHWFDGTSIGYTSWGSGGSQNCVVIGGIGADEPGKWLIVDYCDTDTLPFVCEYEITSAPTLLPTEIPTEAPITSKPTSAPTQTPTKTPTKDPTQNPTKKPTQTPTPRPILIATLKPTQKPTAAEALLWADEQDIGGDELFEGTGKWYECPEGYVIAGFWKNSCQRLNCIEEMRCVAPKISPITTQTCYDKDIWYSWDEAGTVECDDGYFVRGIWSNNNQNGGCGIECWEYLRCCQYHRLALVDSGITETQNWWTCFDGTKTGWCLVDDGDYITGFRRTRTHNLYSLEEAKTRKLFTRSSIIGVPESPQFDGYYVELSYIGLIAAVIVVSTIMMYFSKKNKGYDVVKQIDSDSENAEID